MEKIAVITTDKQLAKLCELECRLEGYDVEVFSSAQALRKSYAKYLWDIDTVPDVSKMLKNNTVRMSRKEELIEDGECLRIPPSLNRLRYMINNSPKNEPLYENNRPLALVLSNRETRTISFGEKMIDLSDHEFKVLEHLCANRGKAVKREELNALLGANGGNISDVYVCHLRKKLESICGSKMISTVRHQGYMIDINISEH